MEITTWLSIATLLSGFLVAVGGLYLTKKKNIQDELSSLFQSANTDRTWLREEVSKLREDVKETRIENLRLRAKLYKLGLDPDCTTEEEEAKKADED